MTICGANALSAYADSISDLGTIEVRHTSGELWRRVDRAGFLELAKAGLIYAIGKRRHLKHCFLIGDPMDALAAVSPRRQAPGRREVSQASRTVEKQTIGDIYHVFRHVRNQHFGTRSRKRYA